MARSPKWPNLDSFRGFSRSDKSETNTPLFAVSAWLCFLKKQGAMLCLSSFTIGLRWNLNDSADQNVVCSLTLLCSEKKVLVLLFLQIYLFLLPTLCIVWVGGDQLPPSFILNFRHLPPRINPTSSQSTQNMPKYEFKARR